jgi:hypothetical protein
MARLREDPRFKTVQPDQFDVESKATADGVPPLDDGEEDGGLELWFDWAFVDFWKNNYCGSLSDRSNQLICLELTTSTFLQTPSSGQLRSNPTR